jgi:predicted dehydrogenase
MGQNHAKALEGLGVPLSGLADPVEEAISQILKCLSDPKGTNCYNDLVDTLHAENPGLLVISTTADGHAAQALYAIEAGVKLVLLEKPLATSLAKCAALREASLSMGSRIAVNHQMRFMPQYTIPNKMLQSDSFGGFCSMHVVAGNFGMAMNATHYFEAFRLIANEPPERVSAWFDSESLPNPRGPQFKDVSGCIRVSTASGHRLYLDASADQGHGVQVTYMARNGRITIDELTGSMNTVVRRPEHRDAPTTRYGMPVVIEQQQIPACELVESTKAVMQALISGENYPTLADATLAVKTLVAAYHSHRQGGIEVPLASIADDDPEVFPWA